MARYRSSIAGQRFGHNRLRRPAHSDCREIPIFDIATINWRCQSLLPETSRRLGLFHLEGSMSANSASFGRIERVAQRSVGLARRRPRARCRPSTTPNTRYRTGTANVVGRGNRAYCDLNRQAARARAMAVAARVANAKSRLSIDVAQALVMLGVDAGADRVSLTPSPRLRGLTIYSHVLHVRAHMAEAPFAVEADGRGVVRVGVQHHAVESLLPQVAQARHE